MVGRKRRRESWFRFQLRYQPNHPLCSDCTVILISFCTAIPNTTIPQYWNTYYNHPLCSACKLYKHHTGITQAPCKQVLHTQAQCNSCLAVQSNTQCSCDLNCLALLFCCCRKLDSHKTTFTFFKSSGRQILCGQVDIFEQTDIALLDLTNADDGWCE